MRLFKKSTRHRKESSMGACALGCLLSIAAIPLLFMNEGRAVATSRALADAASSVVSVDATSVNVNNEGEFVHISGTADTSETLTDAMFGVSVNAIRLVRTVEMYQWKEFKDQVTRRGKDGKSIQQTEYSYEKIWSAELIDASKFHSRESHANPVEFPFASKAWQATDVRVGAFQLPSSLVEKIDASEPVVVDLGQVDSSLVSNLQPTSGTTSTATGFYWSAGTESSPKKPTIGDARIHFLAVPATDVSAMAQQKGDLLQPFKTRNGQSLYMLALGQPSAADMIESAQSQNAVFTWALRSVGTVMLMVGIGLVLRPLTTITGRVPFAGGVIEASVNVAAISLGGGLALLTIAFAWILFRPVVAICLIAVGVGLLWAVTQQRLDQTSAKPPVPRPSLP